MTSGWACHHHQCIHRISAASCSLGWRRSDRISHDMLTAWIETELWRVFLDRDTQEKEPISVYSKAVWLHVDCNNLLEQSCFFYFHVVFRGHSLPINFRPFLSVSLSQNGNWWEGRGEMMGRHIRNMASVVHSLVWAMGCGATQRVRLRLPSLNNQVRHIQVRGVYSCRQQTHFHPVRPCGEQRNGWNSNNALLKSKSLFIISSLNDAANVLWNKLDHTRHPQLWQGDEGQDERRRENQKIYALVGTSGSFVDLTF